MAISKGKETVKQPTGYVTLVSEGGFRFNVPKEAAMLSSTLRDMLSDEIGMQEARSGVVQLPEHSPEVVEKLCEYLLMKWHYIGSNEEVPAFEPRIPLEIALQLLECADFLDS